MSLFALLFLVILVIVAVYLIQSWGPAEPTRTIIYVVMLFFVLLGVLYLLGVVPTGNVSLR